MKIMHLQYILLLTREGNELTFIGHFCMLGFLEEFSLILHSTVKKVRFGMLIHFSKVLKFILICCILSVHVSCLYLWYKMGNQSRANNKAAQR